jgi:hypothetical protein
MLASLEIAPATGCEVTSPRAVLADFGVQTPLEKLGEEQQLGELVQLSLLQAMQGHGHQGQKEPPHWVLQQQELDRSPVEHCELVGGRHADVRAGAANLGHLQQQSEFCGGASVNDTQSSFRHGVQTNLPPREMLAGTSGFSTRTG